jgi:hypothetical protein
MQPTSREPDRPSRAKMTIRVYTVDRSGTVRVPRATVTVPYDDAPEISPLGLTPLPPCRCPRCRETESGAS